MLDVHKDHGALTAAVTHAAYRPAAQPAGIRALLARLAWRAPTWEAETPSVDPRLRRTHERQARLRAEAHAAFRSVEGSGPAALDAALSVLESEIARLSDTAEAYGEALKSVRTYDDDPAQRALAQTALYAYPVPLRTPAPVPHARAARHG